MNCEEFELVVRDLIRSEVGDRSAEHPRGANEHEQALIQVTDQARVNACAGARAHVGGCEACALRLQDERALDRRLASLVTEMQSLEPPARIESELLQAFRQTVAHSLPGSAGILPASSIQRKSGQDARAPRELLVIGGTASWLAAAAAVLLIGFGIALVVAKLSAPKSSGQRETDSRRTLEAKVPAGDSTPVPDGGSSGEESTGSVPPRASAANGNNELAVREGRRGPRRSIRPPANHNGRDGYDGRDGHDGNASLAAAVVSGATPQTTKDQTETEVTTQFIALSYVAPANLQDGGQIVRVELPRSAMASFGLPVNMDRFGERVKADVLVSADGFARAIRFVQ